MHVSNIYIFVIILMLQDSFGMPSEEWLENNPEARGLDFLPDNVATGAGGTGNLATVGPVQPLALVSDRLMERIENHFHPVMEMTM